MKVQSKTKAMNFQNVTGFPEHKNTSVLMEFLYIHKWSFLQFAGVFLYIPAFLGETPAGVGLLGVGAFLFASWRQYVETTHSKAKARREEELHREKMALIQHYKSVGNWEKVGELLED